MNNKKKGVLVPGFVDLQVNGYAGINFSSPELTKDKFLTACNTILEQGTAAFLATVVTAEIQVYKRNLALIAEVVKRDEFQGRLLGIHLEGPFISTQPGFVGAHNPNYALKPDISLLRQMQEWAQGNIRLITLAAELPGTEELADCAREIGMTVSIGHSSFSDINLEKMVNHNVTALTHLGNALPNNLPRHNNPIWAGLANDNLTAMIITDGYHLPDYLIKTVLRAKGIDRTVVVSDVSPIAGLAPGEHIYWGSRIILEKSGRIYNPESGYLVGSGSTMLQCMNHLASLGFLSEEELISLGFYNPLRLIDVDPAKLKAKTKLKYDRKTLRFTLFS
jgi:N-acetylglucosamine-6-phosphate deacetylase